MKDNEKLIECITKLAGLGNEFLRLNKSCEHYEVNTCEKRDWARCSYEACPLAKKHIAVNCSCGKEHIIPRLTVGCRTRILTIEEKPKQTGSGFVSNEDSWRKEFGGREVLLVERSHGSFDVLLLGEGVRTLEKEKAGIVDDEMAWIDEDDMELIDRDFTTNLDYIDWYQEHADDFCPDCRVWFPDNGRDDASCPNQKCYSHNVTDDED